MGSDILQNPADPEATFQVKANKQHRGYIANLTETVDVQSSIVTDYQYDVNTRSDASFIKEYIEKVSVSDKTVVLIADGAYSGENIQELASEKNIGVLTTGLLGRKPKTILSEFIVSDGDSSIISCPESHKPKSCSYIKQTDGFRVSFEDEETRSVIDRIRNGVETVPSLLRNKYRVDKMPFRGKLKTKHVFGFKVATQNFAKLMRFLNNQEFCRAFC